MVNTYQLRVAFDLYHIRLELILLLHVWRKIIAKDKKFVTAHFISRNLALKHNIVACLVSDRLVFVKNLKIERIREHLKGYPGAFHWIIYAQPFFKQSKLPLFLGFQFTFGFLTFTLATGTLQTKIIPNRIQFYQKSGLLGNLRYYHSSIFPSGWAFKLLFTRIATLWVCLWQVCIQHSSSNGKIQILKIG